MANDQISLSTVVVLVIITGLVYKYVIAAPATTPSTARAPQSREATQRSREAAVERIQQMFPQQDRRTLLWDLQRSGGSIQATTERILSGRLETPPSSFQPPPLPRTASPAPAQSRPSKEKASQPDLITRYNLRDRVDTTAAATSDKGTVTGWSANKDERQALLKERRDDMILAARRKMEAKLAAEKSAAAGGQ